MFKDFECLGSFRAAFDVVPRTRVWSTIHQTRAKEGSLTRVALYARMKDSWIYARSYKDVRNDTLEKCLQESATDSLSFWCSNRVALVIMRRAGSLCSSACSLRSSASWYSGERSEGPRSCRAADPLIASHSLWPIRFGPHIKSKEQMKEDSYLIFLRQIFFYNVP